MKTIVVTNLKGGTGKTTTAVSLAAFLVEKNYKVLLVDLDHKEDATRYIQGLGDRITIQNDFPEVNLFQATHRDLLKPQSGAEGEAPPPLAGEGATRAPIIDYTIIDTPPEVEEISTQALTLADAVIIPVDGGTASLRIAKQTFDSVPESLPVWILVTSFRSGTNFGKQMLENLNQTFGGNVFQTQVHYTVHLQESVAQSKPITKMGKSRGYKDYELITEELLRRISQVPLRVKTPVAVSTNTEGVNLDEFADLMQNM